LKSWEQLAQRRIYIIRPTGWQRVQPAQCVKNRSLKILRGTAPRRAPVSAHRECVSKPSDDKADYERDTPIHVGA